jgi:hypothetical protein
MHHSLFPYLMYLNTKHKCICCIMKFWSLLHPSRKESADTTVHNLVSSKYPVIGIIRKYYWKLANHWETVFAWVKFCLVISCLLFVDGNPKSHNESRKETHITVLCIEIQPQIIRIKTNHPAASQNWAQPVNQHPRKCYPSAASWCGRTRCSWRRGSNGTQGWWRRGCMDLDSVNRSEIWKWMRMRERKGNGEVPA